MHCFPAWFVSLRRRLRGSAAAGRAAGLLLGAALAAGCNRSTPAPPARPAAAPTPVAAITPAQAEEIQKFCSACHLDPRADYFPKHAWHEEVQRAYGFWVESGRNDLPVPPLARVVNYYRDQAPEKLEFPLPPRSETPFGVEFVRETLDPVESNMVPGVANLKWAYLRPERPAELISCDMRLGEVRAVDPQSAAGTGRLLAKLNFPARANPVDFDGDGTIDLLVADLGSGDARDHQLGRAVWLKQNSADGSFQPIELLTGVGRLADVRPADFDGDGDLDLVVAEFGWHRTGAVYWLETQDLQASPPVFKRHDLDARPGAIHVPIVDLNGDGKPDILALMSQDYEEVIGWINQGDGTFKRELVAERQDPSFGSSGIEPVDFDGDGDLDLIYTNGDTFDSHIAKPYHGLQWLENQGARPYKLHRLADMIGAYRAVPADLDRDGDLDIVLGGFLPSDLVDRPPLEEHDSLVILEQTAPGQFARHRLHQGRFDHAAIEVADFDGDGDLDIALGVFIREPSGPQPRIVIWRNQAVKNAPPSAAE